VLVCKKAVGAPPHHLHRGGLGGADGLPCDFDRCIPSAPVFTSISRTARVGNYRGMDSFVYIDQGAYKRWSQDAGAKLPGTTGFGDREQLVIIRYREIRLGVHVSEGVEQRARQSK